MRNSDKLQPRLATGTVLRFAQNAVYPESELGAGPVSFDLSGARATVVVFAYLPAACPEPVMPQGFERLDDGAYVAQKRNLYAFLVNPDGSVQYYIRQRP